MKVTGEISALEHTFPLDLGCSGVVNGCLENGLLTTEEIRKTKSQSLDLDLKKYLHVFFVDFWTFIIE